MGDKSIARDHAKHQKRVYREAEERYQQHKANCDVFQCPTCSRLNKVAEDAWDALDVIQHMAY